MGRHYFTVTGNSTDNPVFVYINTGFNQSVRYEMWTRPGKLADYVLSAASIKGAASHGRCKESQNERTMPDPLTQRLRCLGNELLWDYPGWNLLYCVLFL